MNKTVQSAEQCPEVSGRFSFAPLNLSAQDFRDTLSRSSDLFFKSLKLGRVRGLVGIVNAPNAEHAKDSGYIQLTRELIRRDILMIISSTNTFEINETGRTGSGLFENAGDGLAEFCDFIGIQPVQYIDGRINISELYDVCHGLAVHEAVALSDLPAAAVAPEDYQEQAGSPCQVFTMTDNPETTADLIDGYIHDKRLSLGWCDRCGGCFSPFS